MKTRTSIQIGEVFDRLTVVSLSPIRAKNKNKVYICNCVCGKTQIKVAGSSLKAKNTTSCGCYRAERNTLRWSGPPGEASFRKLENEYRYNAKIRNIPFNLTSEEFRKLANSKCAFCGASPKSYNVYFKADGKLKTTTTSFETADRQWVKINGIDRINSDLGYELTNCLPCCTTCNIMKTTHQKSEFLNHCLKIVEFNNLK